MVSIMSQATNKHARKRKSTPAPACTPPVGLSAVDEPPAAWKEVKQLHPGMLVLWRQGDTYAIYGEDRDVALPLIAGPKAKACGGDVLHVPMEQLEITLWAFS
jgi:hypothetical protein